MQQEQYFRNIKREIYLLATFCQDLIQVLSKTLQEGYETILSIDANENMREGKLQRAFSLIGLIETTQLYSDKPPPASHITGSK